jgi:hypothetical protein
MSDTLAPDEDLAPEEARDLEALLSGRVAVPGGQPVAAVLSALRAVPAPGELDGEAAALAAFRLFVLPEGNWPAPAAPGPLTVTRPLTESSPLTLTRPLTVTPLPSGARHRRSRGSWPGRRPAALLGAGAVAAGVVALLCLLLIPGGGPGRGPDIAAGNGPASASGTTAKPQLQGSGASEPLPSPAASRPAAGQSAAATGPHSPAALCRQYLALLGHLGSPGSRDAAKEILRQLSAELGGRGKATAYCLTVTDPGRANPGEASPGPVNWGQMDPGQEQSQIGGQEQPQFGQQSGQGVTGF